MSMFIYDCMCLACCSSLAGNYASVSAPVTTVFFLDSLGMAGLELEADGFHSPQQVQKYMDIYGMQANPDHGLYGDRQVSQHTMLVMNWMLQVASNTYLAGAFYFPCAWMGVHGVLLAVSTAASTALSKANVNTCMQIVHDGIPRGVVFPWMCFHRLSSRNSRTDTNFRVAITL